MHEPAIIVENLSKVYCLDKERPRTFKEYAGGILNGSRRGQAREIRALDSISFEVKRGEAVGIIGSNGSGKSTLLRVLGGITIPTSGKAIIRGRVASVLELGTGFHPDLSGMENIFLTGEMLGMPRAEIRGKIDEIIAFSELEQFIDTPVKYYSSGMFVRLAFSVITHLDADIILLDEVISVGDAAFQVKSFKKMQELLSSGRTILLVSHNLSSISRFSNRCFLLRNGKLIVDGITEKIVSAYAENVNFETQKEKNIESTEILNLREWKTEDESGNNFIQIRKILIRNANSSIGTPIYVDEKIIIELEYVILDDKEPVDVALKINDINGVPLFAISLMLPNNHKKIKQYVEGKGKKHLKCILPENLFGSSLFHIDFYGVRKSEQKYVKSNIITFKTEIKNVNEQELLYIHSNFPILPKVKWQIL